MQNFDDRVADCTSGDLISIDAVEEKIAYHLKKVHQMGKIEGWRQVINRLQSMADFGDQPPIEEIIEDLSKSLDKIIRESND